MVEARQYSKRLGSLELLKAAGIIFLVFVHQLVWLYTHADTGGLMFPEAYSIIRLWAFSLGLHVLGAGIPVLAGVTFYLGLEKKYRSWPALLARAFALSGLGFGMNLFAWGLEGLFDWDVLQFFCLSMIISYPFVKYLPRNLGVGVVALLGVLALSQSAQYPFAQYSGHYLYEVTVGSQQGRHYWPLLPWYSLFAAGVVMGRVLTLKNTNALLAMAAAGAGMAGWAVAAGKFASVYDVDHIWGALMFKPSPFLPLGIIGCQWVLISLLEWLFSTRPAFLAVCGNIIVRAFGQGILWIYMGTIICGYHLTGFVKQTIHFDLKGSYTVFFVLLALGWALGLAIGLLACRGKDIRYVSMAEL